jgi:hypothetical protein
VGAAVVKVELKNVKVAKFASHETTCFEASIYIDGKKAGMVWNDGQGGSNNYHPWELSSTVPEDKVGELLTDWELRKLCRTKTLFRKVKAQYRDGDWHLWKVKYCPETKKQLLAKYGEGVRILNEELK